MQSVALSSGSLAAPLGTEADLARAAARSDASAFAELYRRHVQSMWRLAHALTPDSDAAATAVSDGFVRVLRSVRRRQTSTTEAMRPLLLAGTYRGALDVARSPEQVQRDAEATAAALSSGAHDAESALGVAAFRSLPERWRAAVWLHEVEGLESEALAPVLGVSAAVASQLTARGRRGLLARFEQAGMAAPDHLGTVLRPLAAGVPAGLEAVAVARWRSGVATDPAGRWLPAGGWLSERAARPLSIATAGVLALGLIGLGVLGQHTGVLATGAAVGPSRAPSGAGGGVYPTGASPTVPPGYGGVTSSSPYGLLAATTSGYDVFGGTSPVLTSGVYGGGGGSAPAATTTPVATTPATAGGSGGTLTPPAAAPPAANSGGGSATPPTTAPKTTSPTTVLNAGPGGSITQTTVPGSPGNTSTQINLVPVNGNPAVQVTVGACTQLNLVGVVVPVSCPAGTPVGTQLPPPTAPTPSTTVPSTPPTTTLIGGVLGGLGL